MKKNTQQNFNSNMVLPILDVEDEKITISRRKYESLIEELAYLRGKDKVANEHYVTMTLEAYTELVLIKGRYDEIKEKNNKDIDINKDGIIEIPSKFKKEEF